MMRSLFSGVSGLRNHQTRMDVIGNNIANVNTIGFKGARANFQDVLSQTIQGASSGTGNRGGTNPMQVGLGMGMSSIDTMFTDGSTQPTGKPTDLAIQGQGFFILADGNSQVYTRAGNFDFDTKGNYLVPGSGYKVMGWTADANGKLDTSGVIGGIQIPIGASMPAKASQKVIYANNLTADSSYPIGTSVRSGLDTYDSLGEAHAVTSVFYKVGPNKWLAGNSIAGGTISSGRLKELTFTAEGTLAAVKDATVDAAAKNIAIAGGQLNTAADSVSSFNFKVIDEGMVSHDLQMRFTRQNATTDWTFELVENDKVISTLPSVTTVPPTITVNGTVFNITSTMGTGAGFTPPTVTVPPLSHTPTATNSAITFTPSNQANIMTLASDYSKVTQYGGASTLQATGQDGYAAGTLDTTSIDPSGVIVGRFTNGESKNLAQVALATFNNPGGLNKYGNSLFAKSNNSGEAQVGASGSGGRGSFTPGALEMANVDLAQEFSNMIITQRGFQANSKVITTTDQMLEELANLKR